jgi:hypothetical protein
MSTLVVDTLTGKSTSTTLTIGSTPVVSASANSMTIRGEGSNQTSIQQGLAKAWAKCSADGTSITDSFNITSLADTGTALQTLTIANDMANANYSSLATSIDSTCILIADSHATGTYRLVSRNNAGTLTDSITHSALLGDLA